jgi:hypothetical protein
MRSSAATEADARSRSILDRKPLVSPLASATSSSVRRCARRMALSFAPIRAVSSFGAGSVATAPVIVPPSCGIPVGNLSISQATRVDVKETSVAC